MKIYKILTRISLILAMICSVTTVFLSKSARKRLRDPSVGRLPTPRERLWSTRR